MDGLFGDMRAIFRHDRPSGRVRCRTIAFFDRKLNRETRSEVSRRGRGIIAVVFLVGTATALGLAIDGTAMATCSVPSLRLC